MQFYERLLWELGPELQILMNTPPEKLAEAGGPVLAEAIRRMRCSEVIREEGYDGRFGAIHLFKESEIATATLF